MAASTVSKMRRSRAARATRACSQGETSARMAFSSTIAVIASATDSRRADEGGDGVEAGQAPVVAQGADGGEPAEAGDQAEAEGAVGRGQGGRPRPACAGRRRGSRRGARRGRRGRGGCGRGRGPSGSIASSGTSWMGSGMRASGRFGEAQYRGGRRGVAGRGGWGVRRGRGGGSTWARRVAFPTDLTRGRSVRACPPGAGAFHAPAGQARTDCRGARALPRLRSGRRPGAARHWRPACPGAGRADLGRALDGAARQAGGRAGRSFRRSRISASSCSWVGPPASGAASPRAATLRRLIALTSRNTTQAMIRKLITAVMKAP